MVTYRNYTGLQTIPKLEQENQNKRRKKPELLAPAGDFQSLKAAVENGADAVYVGLKEFNARRQARNFSVKELGEAVRYTHLRNKKIYLAINILVKEKELKQVLDYVEKSLASGIDGFIVQDLGLACTVSKIYEGIRLHASTQINCHNTKTALFLRDLGFTRIVLARETTLEEARKIKIESGAEIEIFGHGALCFSYSGQCLFSSLVGRRSGNRGLCAQPCRLPYRIVIESNGVKFEPEILGHYPLSTRDLCTLTILPGIIESGIDAIKIEGRLKSAEYVAVVTRVYRREIDRAVQDLLRYHPLKESIDQLEEVFSRGFSSAYLTGIRDSRMMSYTRPNNRGAFIGRVVYVDNYTGKVGIALRKSISKGDVLEFWVSRGGRVAQEVKHIFLEGEEVEEISEDKRAEVVVDKNRHLIKPGDRVYRIYNFKLNHEIDTGFRKEAGIKIPIKIFVKITKGEPVYASAFSDDAEVDVVTGIYPEESRNKQLTAENIKKQMEKLGDTPYELVSFEALVDENLYLPVKQLNQVRRDLIKKLDEARLISKKPEYIKKSEHENVFSEIEVKREILEPVLTTKVANLEAAKAALEAGADIVYLKIPAYMGQDELTEEKVLSLKALATQRGKWLGLSIPNVVKDSEVNFYTNYLRKYADIFDVILIDNLGFLIEAQKFHRNIVGDYHLNIFNSRAFAAFRSERLRRLTLSVELSEEEIKDILKKVAIPVELIIHGDIEVMTAEHCPLLAISPVENNFEMSKLRRCLIAGTSIDIPAFCDLGRAYLKDERGYEFPVKTDRFCRGHIFNSKVLCAPYVISKMRSCGINFFRLELLLSRPESEIRTVVRNYRKLLNVILEEKSESTKLLAKSICSRNFTTGHFRRGVL